MTFYIWYLLLIETVANLLINFLPLKQYLFILFYCNLIKKIYIYIKIETTNISNNK